MGVDIGISFIPESLKAYLSNEAVMSMSIRNQSDRARYWCECDIQVSSPLSLAFDSEMNVGKIKLGMLNPSGELSRKVKLYTRPNNYPDTYRFRITLYCYDEDGTIAERVDKDASIACVAAAKESDTAVASSGEPAI